jgi:hypothetical protein
MTTPRTIRVVNVRGLRTSEQRAGIVYVGRRCAGWPGHSLANPYKIGPHDDRAAVESCLRKYRLWLSSLTEEVLTAQLAALWEECEHGAKPLGCWCVNWELPLNGDPWPPECHAQILAAELSRRYCR